MAAETDFGTERPGGPEYEDTPSGPALKRRAPVGPTEHADGGLMPPRPPAADYGADRLRGDTAAWRILSSGGVSSIAGIAPHGPELFGGRLLCQTMGHNLGVVQS